MAAKFERVAKYENAKLPVRKTAESAGYDFYVAEETIVPPYDYLHDEILFSLNEPEDRDNPMTLEEIAGLVKTAHAKTTLVPTGVKCRLDSGTYLELSVRSSCPLKYWLILANGVGRLLF